MGIKQNETETDENSQSPQNKGVPGLFSRLFFCWMFPLFYNGNRRDLDEADMVSAKNMYNSKLVGDKLERNWLIEEAVARENKRTPSLVRVFVKTFFWSYLPGGLMQLIYAAFRTIIPLLFTRLLSYWSADSTMSRETATYYALSMIGANWLAAFFNHHGNLYCQQFGMKLRIAASSLMFRKIMRMNNSSLGETTAGKVVNILSNDLQRFDLTFIFMHYTWIIPLQLLAICYLGYRQAGWAAIVGIIAVILIAMPAQAVISRVIGKVRFSTAEKTDERIKTMNEVINGIQVIKMYAWEIPFEKVVSEKRQKEMKQVRVATYFRTLFLGFMIFTERAAVFFTILTFIITGNSLSATVIYPVQQFINAAQLNMTLILPLILSFSAELFVAFKRIQSFMTLEDRPDLIAHSDNLVKSNLFRKTPKSCTKSESSVKPLSYRNAEVIDNVFGAVLERTKLRRSLSYSNDVAVEVRDVSATWTADLNNLALKNISLRIKKGKLCAIIGAVGSGKSSFLQLLLKELPTSAGTISIYGKTSYSSQEAWLFPDTIRENILFGLPYDAEKYKKVCKVCALEKDFKQFPYADQTLSGERGVSLSGGQRARINLARAVYREADIYLLDDPLSAVDANVGRKLFEGCINGYLQGRTRILVTHQIHFLKDADYIVILNEGHIVNMGTYEDLVKSGRDFSTMLSSLQDGQDSKNDNQSGDKKEKSDRVRKISTTSDSEELPQFEAQKIADEERQSGNLRWEVITKYFLSGASVCYLIFTMSIIYGAAISAGLCDYWISYWSNQMEKYAEVSSNVNLSVELNERVGLFTTKQYLLIHGCLITLCILITNLRVLSFAHLCVSASTKLHELMFSNMLKAFMRFFDTSSSGRILNRFTKDMGAIDEILPRTMLDVLQIYSTLTVILILNAIALYWTMVPSLGLMFVFYIFLKLYMRTAQGIKRIESTTKSPVFGLVTSSLDGIATIRSCNQQTRLINDFDKHQDLNTNAWNGYLSGGATFGFYLDTLCLVYLSIVIFVFIYLDFDGIIPVGSVGLAVTQSSMLTSMLQYGARMLVEFVAQLTSVERVLEYTRIETESNLFQGEIQLPSTWPSHGRILFQNVYLRYDPNEAPVLKDLNINIESGWKVGIVGRTGAGKSSLISALFRFADIEGTVLIDGVKTSAISRQELRSKISIIPQEPVLFSATVRYNLDPFNVYSDDDIWRALEQVDMKSAIPSLDFIVTEGGANFSVGQRQLMCLGRAVLRSNKILIMDEATANIDPQTDNFIQKTIRRQFASCTVLTIAHRLNTIVDSDRVLVMDAGRVAEFDHPYILLQDSNGAFSSMVRETGEESSAKLYQEAKRAYLENNKRESNK